MTDKICIDRAVVEQALAITTHWLELDKRNHCDLLTVSEYKLITGAVENLRAALEQPQVEQEPIAWANINKQGDITHTSNKKMAWAKTPLYTHPQPPRQPLTDEQIKLLIPDGDEWKYEVGFAEATEFARAIERAHGIGGEK